MALLICRSAYAQSNSWTRAVPVHYVACEKDAMKTTLLPEAGAPVSSQMSAPSVLSRSWSFADTKTCAARGAGLSSANSCTPIAKPSPSVSRVACSGRFLKALYRTALRRPCGKRTEDSESQDTTGCESAVCAAASLLRLDPCSTA